MIATKEFEPVARLKDMKAAGFTTVEMLSALRNELGGCDLSKEHLMWACFNSFRVAFDLGIREAMPIMGWCGFESATFRGTISDIELNQQIDPILDRKVEHRPDVRQNPGAKAE